MIDIENLNKAISLTRQGLYKEAESLYMDLLAKNPEDSILLSSIGLFYINIQDFKKADEYLIKACSIKETFGTVSALGFSLFTQKKYEKSAEFLERALDFGENAEIYNKLIISLFHIKNFTKIQFSYYKNMIY